MNEINLLKEKIAQAVRVLANGDILTLNVGHVSHRVPGKEQILILGHTHKKGISLNTITADDIVVMDYEGKVIAGKHSAPGERFMHIGVYKKRDDVQSIVHAHPWYCCAFGVSNQALRPSFWRGLQFSPEVPVFAGARQIDSLELGDQVGAFLGDRTAILFRGHGSLTVGTSLADACNNAFLLEKNAEIQLYANMLGGFKPLEVEETGGHRPTNMYPYYVQRYDNMEIIE